MEKIDGNQIRPGYTIVYKGGLWRVTKYQAARTGKGGAYAQVELVSLKDGTKDNTRFGAGESIERVYLEERSAQFLYAERLSEKEEALTFMDQETYEQITVAGSVLTGDRAFLKEDMIVQLLLHDHSVLSVDLPKHVVEVVHQTDPVVKGQTATSSYKPARLTNGTTVMVPPHIDEGEYIVVDTNTKEYVRRHKDEA
jgi:elongation factor P